MTDKQLDWKRRLQERGWFDDKSEVQSIEIDGYVATFNLTSIAYIDFSPQNDGLPRIDLRCYAKHGVCVEIDEPQILTAGDLENFNKKLQAALKIIEELNIILK
jgi:hypothetical protein